MVNKSVRILLALLYSSLFVWGCSVPNDTPGDKKKFRWNTAPIVSFEAEDRLQPEVKSTPPKPPDASGKVNIPEPRFRMEAPKDPYGGDPYEGTKYTEKTVHAPIFMRDEDKPSYSAAREARKKQ